ncbi:transposase [Streptomyces chartreusis]
MKLLSRRILNDESELELVSGVLALGEDVVWAVDVADSMAALLVYLLLNHGQKIAYVPAAGGEPATAAWARPTRRMP